MSLACGICARFLFMKDQDQCRCLQETVYLRIFEAAAALQSSIYKKMYHGRRQRTSGAVTDGNVVPLFGLEGEFEGRLLRL